LLSQYLMKIFIKNVCGFLLEFRGPFSDNTLQIHGSATDFLCSAVYFNFGEPSSCLKKPLWTLTIGCLFIHWFIFWNMPLTGSNWASLIFSWVNVPISYIFEYQFSFEVFNPGIYTNSSSWVRLCGHLVY
jgi:hypothetical protein